MQNALSILHGRVRDTAGLRPTASSGGLRLFPVSVCFPSQGQHHAPHGRAGHWGGEPHGTAVCPGEGGKGAFLISFQPPSFETELIQSFPTYPRVKAIEKFKTPFPKLPALCFHFRILGEGCK